MITWRQASGTSKWSTNLPSHFNSVKQYTMDLRHMYGVALGQVHEGFC